ncbi:MAG: divergent polysaccharide deacetylase family protein [Deltaproteobacteria bacterium]|nr:divergent polysaccharide deacetylase family protein [Deltaproteobacteria bacterium]
MSVMTGFALAALVLTAKWEEQEIEKTPELPVKIEDRFDSRAEHLRSEVEDFLAQNDFVPLKIDSRRSSAGPDTYQVKGQMPSSPFASRLQRRLQKIDPKITVLAAVDQNKMVIEEDGLIRLVLLFIAPLKAHIGPKAVIIMDDLGRGTNSADALLSLSEPVTFAILPGETHSKDVANLANAAGREVILHIPMEPQGYPAINPGEMALLVGQTDGEIRNRLEWFASQVPHAIGANNHMGSRFTEDHPGMSTVMDVMRTRGWFFVDSVTTGQSRVKEIARTHGVTSLKRDLFLDNVADVSKIRHELQNLALLAKKNGHAVGICHPYPETFEALRLELPIFSELGVRLVSIRNILEDRAD